MVLTLFGVAMSMIDMVFNESFKLLVFIAWIVQIYFWVCVYSLFLEMKTGRTEVPVENSEKIEEKPLKV